MIATYRIQFQPEFPFVSAAALAPYLKQLGVSHLYASPFLQAAPGSLHGYDVVDYQHINQALGGAEGLERLNSALQAQGLGQVLDIVPNHMAIHPTNPWWWDVLKNGPSSPYASYFDVDWDPPEARHSNAVLVPVLGDHYGRVLEAGEIELRFNGADFTVRYYDNVYPVDPATLGHILRQAAERLRSSDVARDQLFFLSGAFDRLPSSEVTDLPSARRRFHDTEVLRGLLVRLIREHSVVKQVIDEVVAEINANPDALDAFLERQNYRLAFWRISVSELGYRRFFNINSMIGLRMEDREVYQDTHALIFDLLQQGTLDGLRIDHPDGLRDPTLYLQRLREDVKRINRPDAWIVVEKILEPGEQLRATWPIQGTTGYDFLNRVNGLFIDPAAKQPLTDFYTQVIHGAPDYAALVHEKKLFAAAHLLGSDLGRLTELFLQICEQHRRYRDYRRAELRDALAETAACLPVYRTYVQPANPAIQTPDIDRQDADRIEEAIQAAKDLRPDLDPRLLDFLADLLLLRVRGAVETELVDRFQQFTGPVMAKGVEDTVFYLYNRFVSLNEVGGDPGRFGVTPAEFHQANLITQAQWPFTQLTTSTHDTKRSEDVRARLNVLSEIPEQWTAAVKRWLQMNASQRTDEFPDRNLEYLIYQTLVGVWPISTERVLAYVEKAAREAKQYTSWANPNAEYEQTVANFVQAILKDQAFVADLTAFVEKIISPGRVNALAQTLLKLTSPGIPDIYQGSELWNLSLVDPDNRRPVDYALRQLLLAGLQDDTPPEKVLEGMPDGLPKLWVIRQALALRAEHVEWFGDQSSYLPLTFETAAADSQAGGKRRATQQEEATAPGARSPQELLVAITGNAQTAAAAPLAVGFLRAGQVAVIVPRFTLRYSSAWASTRFNLPEGRWRNRLTHEQLRGGSLSLAEVLSRFPVALLVKAEEGADGI